MSQVALRGELAGEATWTALARRRLLSYVVLAATLFIGYFLLRDSDWRGSTELHTLMEAVAALLAFTVGIIALVRYHSKTSNTFLLIGTAFIGTALLDGYHAIVTSQFFAANFPSVPAHLIPWSWIASRLFLSVLLFVSWWAWRREEQLGERGRISERAVYTSVAALTVACFLVFALVPLGRAYFPEIVFHRPEEFGPAAFFLAALVGYLQKGHWRRDAFEHWLVLSLIVGFMGQALFMSLSGQLFDYQFDAAHLLKKVSYVLVLTGLLISMYHLFKQAEESKDVLEAEVEQRRRAEQTLRSQASQLREQARRDSLTRVLNHAAIVAELRAVVERGDREGPHAVVMVDVDGLKAVNDTYGHQVGDAVLVAVSTALTAGGGTVGRYGGDEFVVVLEGADRVAAEQYREGALERLADATLTDPETDSSVPVVASIGLAVCPDDARSLEQLIQASDAAMYSQKRERRAGISGLGADRPLGTDPAAELVGQLVPLLTEQEGVNAKLKLVSQRLSSVAGYDGVNIVMFSSTPTEPLAKDAFARAPEELVQAWNGAKRDEATDETHPIRVLIERTKRPVILDDLWNDERLWESQRAILRAADLKTALVAPLIWEDATIGMIAVASRRERAFSADDAQFLATVATYVTAIIRMATLFELLQKASGDLAEAREQTVLLLAASAEAHDPATGRHLRNLRSLAEALAVELGFEQGEAAELGLAAVLHDIGKIRVPDSILAKPGKLAEKEWELMMRHTTWGEEFLTGYPGFEPAATIARSHHERWDGRGYPDGLSGEAIPGPATIVTVADAYDAMTSDRPYRKGRPTSVAIQELMAYSGQQFSPTVVQALVALHERGALARLRTPAEGDRAAA